MKAKLVVEGKEFDIEILDPKLQELIAPKKKTGYERVDDDKHFYHSANSGHWISEDEDVRGAYSNDFYNAANYYSSRELAINNTRADTLMRKLRRFAVEHREYEMNWKNVQAIKYYIYYDYSTSRLLIEYNYKSREFGSIYFRSRENAELAIQTFKDELIWYFTEYKDSLWGD